MRGVVKIDYGKGRATSCVAPAAKLTFFLIFSHPLNRPKGDLSKLKLPDSLQELKLGSCKGITGKIQPRLMLFLRRTNSIEQPLVRPQPQRLPNSSSSPKLPSNPSLLLLLFPLLPPF